MLNDRARSILAFIQRSKREKGYPPTIREIGEEFGISSTNGVRYYLTLLEKNGHLKRINHISRGIDLIDEPMTQGIPILGRVAAGQPIHAEQSYEGSLDTQQMFGSSEGLFALKVRGDSMKDAGILEGDHVIVRHQSRANSGEIVVAVLGDEATVKYYRPHGDRIELVPANENYEPIVVTDRTELHIIGVVRGVLRTIGR